MGKSLSASHLRLGVQPNALLLEFGDDIRGVGHAAKQPVPLCHDHNGLACLFGRAPARRRANSSALCFRIARYCDMVSWLQAMTPMPSSRVSKDAGECQRLPENAPFSQSFVHVATV